MTSDAKLVKGYRNKRRYYRHPSVLSFKNMERRGSGLKKILNETQNLPGYADELKPKFHSDTSFRVIIYNVNYGIDGLNVGKDVGLNVGLKRADQILIFI